MRGAERIVDIYVGELRQLTREPGSLLGLPGSKRRFSSSRMSPGPSASTSVRTVAHDRRRSVTRLRQLGSRRTGGKRELGLASSAAQR